MTGHKQLAAYLSNPQFAENLFTIVGLVATIVAGVSEGIKRDNQPAISDGGHQRTPDDPYKGYDYDPLRGWVKVDEQELRSHA